MKIETGVPIPVVVGMGRRRQYPWQEMAVGDSFIWPEWSKTQDLNGVKAHATMASKQIGNKGKAFRAYRNAETGEIRVWRIA